MVSHGVLKEEMKICASIAGMTKGPECPPDSMHFASPHPLMIMIEPEAASFYVQSRFELPSYENNFFIVDVDGGNVDLVLHKKTSAGFGLEVQNLARSSGGLFGGSLVDKAFFYFLSGKIICFRKFARARPEAAFRINNWCETMINTFDGDMTYLYELDLPATLAQTWEEDESSKNRSSSAAGFYDAIVLSVDDILGLFDPIVNDILRLIKSSMIVNGLLEPIDSNMSERLSFNAITIIGSFSRSPYLRERIKQELSAQMWPLVLPDEPGSVLCCGAVKCGIERARGFWV